MSPRVILGCCDRALPVGGHDAARCAETVNVLRLLRRARSVTLRLYDQTAPRSNRPALADEAARPILDLQLRTDSPFRCISPARSAVYPRTGGKPSRGPPHLDRTALSRVKSHWQGPWLNMS